MYNNSFEIQKRLAYAKNYNQWLFSLFEKHLGNCILEIGCAIGNFTDKIINRNFICATDVEEEYITNLKNRYKDVANFKAIKCDISSKEAMGLKEYCFDTILCFNVLEHVENDRTALSNMHSILSDKGYLCMVVPAFEKLFGGMDIADNHYRRYNRSDLEKKIKSTGFRILSLSYINLPGFFGWWLNARVLKRRFIPFRQMLIYDKFVPLVSSFEGLLRLPFGQSLKLIAIKG